MKFFLAIFIMSYIFLLIVLLLICILILSIQYTNNSVELGNGMTAGEKFSNCSILGERNCLGQSDCGWCIKNGVGKCQDAKDKIDCDQWTPSQVTPVINTPIITTPVVYDYN